MRTRITVLLLIALLLPVFAHSQGGAPSRQDNSLPPVREQGIGSDMPDSEVGVSVPVIPKEELPAAESEAMIKSNDKKDVAPTDFVAQADNDVFTGSKKGQKYHISEDAFYEQMSSEEDRSNWQLGKIHPLLTEQAVTQDQVKVIIHLKAKPLSEVSKAVKEQTLPEVDTLAQDIKEIFSKKFNKKSVANSQEEKSILGTVTLTDAEKEKIKARNEQIDAKLDAMRRQIAEQTKQKAHAGQRKIIDIINRYNGQVGETSVLANSIGAVVSAQALEDLAKSPLVESITPDYEYVYDLDDSACMLGASSWWNAGYDGGAYDAALLDSGIKQDHVYLKYRTPPASDPRNIFKRYPDSVASHGTRTAGVIASTHGTYKGIAFGLETILNAGGHNSMTESDVMGNADWVINCPISGGQAPEVINNSYSLYDHDDEFGPLERFWDSVVDDLYIMVTKSAGNAGLEELGYPQSHNLISVANLDIKETCLTTDDVITSSSSRGPTQSGRRKPDISAPGTNTYSTDSASTTAFANHGGTSAAAPHVAGAIIMMEDGGNHNPMAQKAVLINTARAWSDAGTLTVYGDDGPVDGDHWDPTYGWGVMDLDHAFLHRTDYFYDSVVARDDLPDDDDYKLYKGYMYATDNDKATLVWNRRAVYNGSSEPTNYYTLTDLNMRLYGEDSGSLLDSDTVGGGENVHQVSASASQPVVIKVYSWSTSISGATSENYVLATEQNFERADPPEFSVTLAMPAVVYYNTIFTVTATVQNTGDVMAHNNSIDLVLPAGFTRISGTDPQSLGSIDAGLSKQAVWTVRSPVAPGGNFTISVVNTSSCYDETYTKTRIGSIEVSDAGRPNLTDVTPTGWSYPIVPRNVAGATSTSCPITSTLPGNTSSTYYNWAWINDSAIAAGNHRTSLYVDGELFFWSTPSLGAGATQQYRNINGAKVVTGGRHTVYYQIDEDLQVLESDETDNTWSRQFVWSPYSLSDDTPVSRTAPPVRDAWAGSGGWYNNDGFSFILGYSGGEKWWSAVGIIPADANSNYGLRLWGIGDYTGSQAGFGSGYLEWSTYSADQSDFVIVNDNQAVAGTYYAAAINDNAGTADYRIEEATSKPVSLRPGTQWNGVYAAGSTSVLDMYEVYIPSPGQYFFLLDQTAGICDLAMSLYDDETVNAKKSEYMAGGYANSAGDGADEYFQIDIPDAGFHGLAIWKVDSSDYDKTSSYRIAVGPPACTVISPNGGETLNAGQSYTISWDNFGNRTQNVKIEITRDNGSTWQSIIDSTQNDGSYKWSVSLPGSTQCLIRITSTSAPDYTDTSDATFTIDASGIPAEINVRDDTASIPWKSTYDFGSVNLGYDKTVTFTIENIGGANLNLTGSPRVQITGTDAAYFVVTAVPSTPITSMASTDFDMQFAPDAARAYSATVSIPNNDSDENPYLFKLTAQGTLPRTLYVDDDAVNDPGPNNPAISDPDEDGSIEHPFDMIQEGIDAAFHHEDTVIVLPGTYNENVDFTGKSIAVRSTNPDDPAVVDSTVIDALGKGSVVSFVSGEGADSVLEGFRIKNGAGSEVDFAGTVVWAGGGIFCLDSSPTVRSCTIVSNRAELGGGIYCNNSDMTIASCAIHGNRATNFHGGGIHITQSSHPQVVDCSVYGNATTACGGGIACQVGSSAAISYSRIYGNKARHGGGIYVSNSPATQLKHSLIYENISNGTGSSVNYDGGGAMALWGAPVLCENCTFYGNEAVVEGGAIQCAYTTGVVMRNCIFWGNSAPSGTNIYLRFNQQGVSFASTMDAYYSDWEGAKSSVVVDAGCTFTWGTGNFGKDPLFSNPAGADYHLKSTAGRWNPAVGAWVTDAVHSACIDSGDPASDWTAELWPHGKRINVGAYGGTSQASMSESLPGNICDLNNDGIVDWVDIAILCESWLDGDLLIPANTNRTGNVDFCDYGICGSNWMWHEP